MACKTKSQKLAVFCATFIVIYNMKVLFKYMPFELGQYFIIKLIFIFIWDSSTSRKMCCKFLHDFSAIFHLCSNEGHGGRLPIFHGPEVCNVGVQRNNFCQLIKVIKQWKFYLNLCYKVIWYCKK